MHEFYEAEDWLRGLYSEKQFFHEKTKPSLDIVEHFLDELDRPDKSFEWRIVVGGTAGKGTVCRTIEDALIRSGKKVATLISPHVQVITERIRINGKLIAPKMFANCVAEIRKISKKTNITPTYYEAIVLTGILAGKVENCGILICEVGLGGEFDAVNSVRGKRISAVTFIGKDHTEILGESLAKIAKTKAGIFTHSSVENYSYEQKMCSILDSVAKSKVNYIKGIKAKLNKKLARKVCAKVLQCANVVPMKKQKLPARWEKVEKNVILEGAHSAPRFEFILPKIKKLHGKKIGVFGMTKNHDPKSFEIISQYFDEIFWTSITEGREFWKPAELQKIIKRGQVSENPEEALKSAKKIADATVVVLGSFYLCGEIRNLYFDPEEIIRQQDEFLE